jgi:hypothetical protein
VTRAVVAFAALLLAAAACRGEPRAAASQPDLDRLVDSLRPAIEQATGLRFSRPPRVALRTREQARAYLDAQLAEELSPERVEGIETAYRLLGLLPDSVRLRPLLLDLLTEQVAGYYEPDSGTLYGVAGADPMQQLVVVAHELVHALQDQHLPLDSILERRDDNDRTTAAQAVLEGQATFASLRALAPRHDLIADPAPLEELAQRARSGGDEMPELARAPLVVREALIFPYVDGAEFMRWWARNRPDTVPYGPRMPVSTEQIRHPERWVRGDVPVAVRFADPADAAVLHEDALGSHEIAVMQAVLEARTLPSRRWIGWGGDRYRVYRSDAGPAMVWYTVWDDSASAAQFRAGTGASLLARRREGYRATLDTLTLGGRAALRYVLAPAAWERWGSVPGGVAE